MVARFSSGTHYYCYYFSAQAVCTDGDVRLEDKEGEYVGRVGLCYRGEWGSVNGYYTIDDKAAAVVCSQLKLPVHGEI